MNRCVGPVLLVLTLTLTLTACPGGGGGGTDGGGGGGNDGGNVADGGGGGGNDGGTVTDGGTGPLTAAQACTQYYDTLKARLVECYGAPPAQVDALVNVSAVCAGITRAISAGRVGYDTNAVGSCFASINVACKYLLANVSAKQTPCSDMFHGQVADGDPCYTAADCSIHSTCSASGQTCPGTCDANVPNGLDCTGAGAVCDNGVCNGQYCQPYGQQGDSCGSSSSVGCSQTLYCQGATPTAAGTCQQKLADGSTCSTNDNCQLGDGCYNGTCSTVHTVGDPCNSAGDCGLFEYCNAGTCAQFPGLGGTCGMSGQDFIGCLGSYCKVTNSTTYVGTCTAYVPEGGTCTPNTGSCAPGSTCIGTTCTANCTEP